MTAPKSQDELLVEADGFCKTRDYEKAIIAYQEVLKTVLKRRIQPQAFRYQKREESTSTSLEVIEGLENVLKQDKKSATLYTVWGLVLASRGLFDDAIERFQQAVSEDEKYFYAYRNWGEILYKQNDYAGAIEQFQKAFESNPNLMDVYLYARWGKAFAAQGKPDDAIRYFDCAIKEDQSFINAYYEWAAVLAGQPDRFEDAIQKYMEGINLASGIEKADGYRRLGDAFREKGSDEDAIKQYDKAIIDIDESYVDVYYKWADGLDWDGKFDEAIQKYKKAIEVVKDQKWKAKGHKRLGDAYKAKKLYDKANEEYGYALEKDQNYIDVYYAQADALATQSGRFDEAVEKYEEGIKLAIGDEKAQGYKRLGDAFREKGRDEDAINQYDKAIIDIDETNVDVYYRWARAIARQPEKFDEAVEKYKKAIDVVRHPKQKAEAHKQLGDALRKKERYEEAFEQYNMAIDIDETYASGYYRCAQELAKNPERFREAIEKYEKVIGVIEDPKQKSEGYKQLGDAYKEKGYFDEAIKSYESAHDENSKDASPLLFLGHCYYSLKNYSQAEIYYDQFLNRNRDEEKGWDVATAYRMLGWVSYAKGDFDKAIENFVLAEKKYQNYGWGYVGKATVHRDKGEYNSALTDIQKAIELQPRESNFYLECGNCYRIQGDFKKALEQYRIAADKSDNAASSFWLGYLLSDMKMYDEAIVEYEKAEAKKPSFSWDFDPILASHNHADILQRQGKYSAAKKKWRSTYEEYLRIEPVATRWRYPDIFQYSGSIAWEFFQEFDEKEIAFKAEHLYKRGLGFDPEHVGLLLSLLEFYMGCKELLEYSGAKQYSKNKWLTQVNSVLRTSEESALVNLSNSIYWQAMQNFQKLSDVLEKKLKNAETQKLSEGLRAQYYLDRAKANLAIERCDDAKRDALTAIKLDDKTADAHSTLGVILMRLEKYKAAIQSFKAAVERDVDNLGYLSNLAEAYRKAEMLDDAKKQYEIVLKISPYHLDSIIGLAETYVAIGDGPKDGKRSADAEEMYMQAIEFYSRSLALADSDDASKVLRPKEIAAVHYARGYARVMLFESQSDHDEKLLRDAQRDFESIPLTDKNYQKAKRSAKKIAEKLRPFSPSKLEQAAGAWVIAIAVFVFLVGQFIFFVGQPTRVPPSYKFTNAGVEALKAADVPDAQLVNISLRVPERFDSQQALLESIGKVAGDTMTLDIQQQILENIETIPSSIDFQPVDVGYYALFTFGPLIFVVAGAYLQQISRLKFAGIEIEKSTVDQISTSSSLGVSK